MGSISKKERILIFLTGSLFTFSILSVWFLWKNPDRLTLVLLVLSFLELIAIKSKKVLIIYIFCGICGGVVESIAVYLGIWEYSLPTFYFVPFWLMPLWGNAGIFIVCFYKLLGKVAWLNNKPPYL
jgi:hypothetical protein